MAAVCNGATYSASPSSNAGTVPDHGVFRALISVAHPVSVPSVLVKAGLFRLRLALTVEAPAPSITGTNQGTAQVSALPLLVYSEVKTTAGSKRPWVRRSRRILEVLNRLRRTFAV